MEAILYVKIMHAAAIRAPISAAIEKHFGAKFLMGEASCTMADAPQRPDLRNQPRRARASFFWPVDLAPASGANC